MNKTLIIIRHAHRDKPNGGEADNGLSSRGHRQARLVAKYFVKIHDQATARLISSPKLRCLETLEPLAKKIGANISISPLLDEQSDSAAAFAAKVSEFCQWWIQKAPRLTVVCSHGDWIPLAMKKLIGMEVGLSKGAWAAIEIESGKPRLRELVQELDR